jgi:hypothetical protein
VNRTLCYFLDAHTHLGEKKRAYTKKIKINWIIKESKKGIKIYDESEADDVARLSCASCHNSPIVNKAIHRRRRVSRVHNESLNTRSQTSRSTLSISSFVARQSASIDFAAVSASSLRFCSSVKGTGGWADLL